MKAFHQMNSWLKYQWKAGTKHSVHSPFVFQLYTNVIQGKKNPSSFDSIEKLRFTLFQNTTKIQVRDFGSAQRGSNYERSISSIARMSAKSPALAALLGRLVIHFSPRYLFDLGTSLGITTAYLSSNQNTHVFTFEGCEQTLKQAEQNLTSIGRTNIRFRAGELDLTLPKAISEVPQLDFVFFDANHQYQPTMKYFQLCLEKIHNETVFVFDDIYWSEEMTRAWEDIKAHPSVTVSIDLFSIGLVFFRKEQVPQHFCLRF